MHIILHICAGWEKSNGAANIARMVAGEQETAGHSVSYKTWASIKEVRATDEVWIHCAWKPCLWWAALWAKRYKWMPEASYDPVRLRYHGWKKWLAGPIERFFLRRADVVVATCQAEAEWIRKYEPRVKKIEVTDVKRFFVLSRVECTEGNDGRVERVERVETESARKGSLHLLYLGRRHPLKGLEYLEAALKKCGNVKVWKREETEAADEGEGKIEFRVESSVLGEEKERMWEWCDVLVLPTLSENFGLVIAEALERGKRVITTDGAPAWGDGNTYGGRLVYLKGYLNGSREERISLLESAIVNLRKGM